MKIICPDPGPMIYEGIPNCYVGQIDGAQLYPPHETLSQCVYPPAELIVESMAGESPGVIIELSPESVREAVSIAAEQYVENVGEDEIEQRFQDYLTEDVGLSLSRAIELFRSDGLAPFLLLERVFISHPLSAMCLDFTCVGEEYIEEYQFSLDRVGDKVEFVTPRSLMPEGSYPASRKN